MTQTNDDTRFVQMIARLEELYQAGDAIQGRAEDERRAKEERLGAEIAALDAEILETPAQTPLGIAIKLRLALTIFEGGSGWEGGSPEDLTRAALADASRLCGGADDLPAIARLYLPEPDCGEPQSAAVH